MGIGVVVSDPSRSCPNGGPSQTNPAILFRFCYGKTGRRGPSDPHVGVNRVDLRRLKHFTVASFLWCVWAADFAVEQGASQSLKQRSCVTDHGSSYLFTIQSDLYIFLSFKLYKIKGFLGSNFEII